MNIGLSATDLGPALLLAFLALLAPTLLVGIGALLTRLLRLSGILVVVLICLVLVGTLLGGSFYLDAAGRRLTGLVVEKQEKVELRAQGDWRYTFHATMQYALDGDQPDAQSASVETSAVGLALDAARFDQLQEGKPVELRVLPIWRSITLVRLAENSTRDWIPWNWIAIAAGVLLFGWLALRLARSMAGFLAVAALLLLAAIAWPAATTYLSWQAREALAGKPLRAQARIGEVTRITRIDPLPCYRNCARDINTRFDVPQQYDIVQMSFVPQGAREPVTAMDSADTGARRYEPGELLEIAYAPDDPRAAQIIGASHSHLWKNMIAFVGMWSVGPLVVVGLLGLGIRAGSRRKRARTGEPSREAVSQGGPTTGGAAS